MRKSFHINCDVNSTGGPKAQSRTSRTFVSTAPFRKGNFWYQTLPLNLSPPALKILPSKKARKPWPKIFLHFILRPPCWPNLLQERFRIL